MVKIDFNYFLVKIAKSEPECGIEIMSYFPTDPKGYSIEPFYLKNVVITSQIIKAHKGKIWAESEGKDNGSTFYVELPV